MKNKYNLKLKTTVTFLILIFTLTINIHAQSPQYYNANTGGIGNTLPFGSLAATGYKTQWLIGPGEYNQPSPAPAGNITKLYIWISSSGSGTYTNLTIKMGQTSLTAFPPGTYAGQLDTVFFNASASLTATTNTWLSITLNRPYYYNPAQSLVIEVSHCGISGSGFNIWQTAGTVGINRRNNHSGTPQCIFTYGGQDSRILQNGIDVAPPNCNYTWATQTSGTTSLLQSVKAISSLVAWAAGAAGTVRITTNGGTTWANGNPNPGVITGDIYNIYAIDATTAWCTTSPSATYIYRTTNGGTNWTQVFTQAGGFIDAIWMTDANTGFAYGDPVALRWSLWKTTNGGVNWDSTGLYLAQVASEAGWNNAMYVIGNNIWFGTNSTKVYRSTTFGTSWTSGPTTGTVNSYSLHFNSATTGLVGGSSTAFIVRTTDGGTTYSSVLSLPTGSGNITGLAGVGTDYWALRGNNIHRSSNNGDNWTQSFTGTTTLWDIDVVVSGGCPQGWAVGATGTIVKMTGVPVGVSSNNNQIPDTYILSQNYPNPFNPATMINYSIPRAGNVELRVYDILGREVATIVNEFRQAGSYSVNFNASELASGVYIYTIKSGEFTDSKKMVLIK